MYKIFRLILVKIDFYQNFIIIGSQIKRQFDFRFDNFEKFEKTTRMTIIFAN